jgi:diadenosine tetraphosphate (Ap4A) HIT family hydrolase
MEGCLACDLAEGRLPLPGGRIAETAHWLVDHAVGPLGVGTLIVRPKRHVLHVWQLNEAETVESGPFFRWVARALAAVAEPEQIYMILWSHADATPGHIHWVFQPVTTELSLSPTTSQATVRSRRQTCCTQALVKRYLTVRFPRSSRPALA